MDYLRRSALALTVLLGGAALTACEQEGPLEQAGEEADQAVENTGEAVEDAGEELEQ
jgi:predicted small lipoprotein YifL